MDKATLGFHMYKIWEILKRFTGTFRRAQTLKLGGVNIGITFFNNLVVVNSWGSFVDFFLKSYG